MGAYCSQIWFQIKWVTFESMASSYIIFKEPDLNQWLVQFGALVERHDRQSRCHVTMRQWWPLNLKRLGSNAFHEVSDLYNSQILVLSSHIQYSGSKIMCELMFYQEINVSICISRQSSSFSSSRYGTRVGCCFYCYAGLKLTASRLVGSMPQISIITLF